MNNPNPNTPPGQHIGKLRGHLYRAAAKVHPSKKQRFRLYAHAGLAAAGRMHYTQGAERSQFFHAKPHQYVGEHADCSQYAAGCAHRAGIKRVTDTDWTGTLAKKGRKVTKGKPGTLVLFGRAPFVHAGIMGTHGYVLGFGSSSGPDRVHLDALLGYFAARGHPGHEFRDLTA